MRRVAFLFDGYNLYHSLRLARRFDAAGEVRWLDLVGLGRSVLHEVGRGAELERAIYFSALAGHIDSIEPGATNRHMLYMDALRSTGVEVELGSFKEKRFRCTDCGAPQRRFEEKESDVAIAVRLLELLWTDACDAAVLVSADSDLSPAVRTARRQFPNRPVLACFPFGRGASELRAVSSRTFRLRRDSYAAYQLPDPLVTPSGRVIRKPASW